MSHTNCTPLDLIHPMKPRPKKLSMHLNLAEKNPSRLLHSIQEAFAKKPEKLTIELVGPGSLYNDTALMLHEEIRKRPAGTRIHMRARTCLLDGAILIWLAADTRSMRSDTWIQLSQLPEESIFSGNDDYPSSIRSSEESPADTDFRTIVRYLDEFLPVNEIAGFRLFESDLRELGILDDPDGMDPLMQFFNPAADESQENNYQNTPLRSDVNQ
jgi:hypothetical protein